MENSNKKILNVPTLRFKEFKDEWLIREFDQVAAHTKGKGLNRDSVVPFGKPCILYGDMYTIYHENPIIKTVINHTNDDISSAILSEENNVIVPASGETKEDISSAGCVKKTGVILGGDLNVLRLKPGIIGSFLAYQIRGVRKFDIAKVAQGNSVVHLNYPQLKTLKFSIPSEQEQEKISCFIESIDKRIEVQRKLIEAYESLIKVIRHTYFNRISSDSAKQLGDLCSIKTGKLDANAMKPNGQYKFFTCSKEDYWIDTYAFDGKAILIAGNGEVGLTKYYDGKFNAYQRTYVLQAFSLDARYIKSYIDEYLPRIIKQGTNNGAMPYITLDILSKFIVKMPTESKCSTIVQRLLKFESTIENLKLQYNEFSILKKELLKMLFI